jgi:hypothetical protein
VAALETSSGRVLLVEDSEESRKFICSTLGERPELQIAPLAFALTPHVRSSIARLLIS